MVQQDINILGRYLTLDACTRVMVVVPRVCYHASCYIPLRWKQGAIWLLVAISMNASCGFHRKHSVQKFWRHLLTILAFFSSWWTLSIYSRDSNVFFSTRVVCRSIDSSYILTDSWLVSVNCQLSFLAFACWVSWSCNHVVIVMLHNITSNALKCRSSHSAWSVHAWFTTMWQWEVPNRSYCEDRVCAKYSLAMILHCIYRTCSN